MIVRLAPFDEASLQHFIHLERPINSGEPDGVGFSPERPYERGTVGKRLTPTAIDYAAVGQFYAALGIALRSLVERIGESAAFCGDPALQLSPSEVNLAGAQRVVCLKTALAAFDSIVRQGEGAPEHSVNSHFERFTAIRAEYGALKASNPGFQPGLPAATNPVLRRPPRPEGRVWIEHEPAIATVDLANACYGLMLRLVAYTYSVPAPHPDKALAMDLGVGLMRAMAALGEHAARLPAGPSNPACHAGMSFTALRDASSLSAGPSARRFFIERFGELAAAAADLAATGDARPGIAARLLKELAERAERRFDLSLPATVAVVQAASTTRAAPTSEPTSLADGVESVEGQALTLMFEASRCIHARFCVTGAPTVFLANVQGPWIHPDTMNVERLAEIAHVCPSGAIRYRRKDGGANEAAPPVNLAAIREGGPYAFRGQLQLDGEDLGYRATLCRCGASKHKPFCDSSHHDVGFSATGEPPSEQTDMLPVRDGALAIDPQPDGPLQVRGSLEIISGTGRVVARVNSGRLCRCGGSGTKPFCDGTHAKIGFRT
ncbi:MAG: CDGSH iron-sulfur domain-containing protein [Steroidobacterales bacterium]